GHLTPAPYRAHRGISGALPRGEGQHRLRYRGPAPRPAHRLPLVRLVPAPPPAPERLVRRHVCRVSALRRGGGEARGFHAAFLRVPKQEPDGLACGGVL